MTGQVVFYRLSRRYGPDRRGAPEQARQLVYVSLALGHHVGLIDCLSPILEVPDEAFAEWLTALHDGPARHKLAGVLQWDEVEIDSAQAGALLEALQASQARMQPAEQRWAAILQAHIQNMADEPAMYLMVRRRP